MTSANLRKSIAAAAVLQGDSRERGCRMRCVSARDRKRGLAKVHTYWYIFCRPTRLRERHSFRDGVASGELSAAPERDKLMPTYTYAYARRETAVKDRARAMAKKLLRLKFPGTRIRAATTYFALLLRPCDPAARETLPYCTSKVHFTYRTDSIENVTSSVARNWARRQERCVISRCCYIFFRKLQYFIAHLKILHIFNILQH